MAFPLYFDDDAESKAIVQGLIARGIDAIRANDSGMRGEPDSNHLVFASGHARVLYTADRGDFIRLHRDWLAEGKHHAGIIVLTQQRYSAGEQVRRLEVMQRELSATDFIDRLEFLSNWG